MFTIAAKAVFTLPAMSPIITERARMPCENNVWANPRVIAEFSDIALCAERAPKTCEIATTRNGVEKPVPAAQFEDQHRQISRFFGLSV